jgi:hypothetical protein
MDVAYIEWWLKNTIPGIVILGAIGSILAVLVLAVLKKLLAPLASKLFVGFVHAIAGILTKPVAIQQSKLFFGNAQHKFQIYYTLQIMKLIWCLFIGICALLIFLFVLQTANGDLYKTSLLLPLFLFFLFLWWAFRAFLSVFVPHVIDIDAVMQKTKDDVFERNQEGAN